MDQRTIDQVDERIRALADPNGTDAALLITLASTYSPLDRGTAAQLATWKSKQANGTEYVWNLTDGAGTLLDIVSGVV